MACPVVTHPVTRLILIRHPQPAVAQGICYGQTDVPLSPGAVASLSADARRLRGEILRLLPCHVLAWHASPLSRCRLLADALLAAVATDGEEDGSPPLAVDNRLREMNFGDWEGRSWDDIGTAAVNAWARDIARHRPPQGESVADLAARVGDWLVDALTPSPIDPGGRPRGLVVVTHGGVIRALAGQLCGEPIRQWSARMVPFASITCLEVHPGAHGRWQGRVVDAPPAVLATSRSARS